MAWQWSSSQPPVWPSVQPQLPRVSHCQGLLHSPVADCLMGHIYLIIHFFLDSMQICLFYGFHLGKQLLLFREASWLLPFFDYIHLL